MFTGTEWTFDSIDDLWESIREVSKPYGWQGFPVIFEIVSAEQMINCYVSHGMPNMYNHWSFGRRFLEEMEGHCCGHGLAYELIINSNPSVCYLMDTNTQQMQLLTMTHAGIGHNYFFKHNYMFKQWTKPEEIIDFLEKSKRYIEKCELKYGFKPVNELLEFAHGVQMISIDKHFNKQLSNKDKKARHKERIKELRSNYNPVNDGSYEDHKTKVNSLFSEKRKVYGNLIKALCEKGHLKPWQNKILTIVQKIMQYFYPQGCTKMMNEGFASFVQYILIHDLYDKKLIGEDYMFEFYDDHTSVVNQQWFNGKQLPGINPYYLGFNMFMDIKRMCEKPTQEDIDFCPEICNTNWLETINNVVANYRDDSFIQQFLSPYLIRKLKLVTLNTTVDDEYINVTETHDVIGYDNIREKLAERYNWDNNFLSAEIYFDDLPETEQLNIKINTPLKEQTISLDIHYLMSYILVLNLWDKNMYVEMGGCIGRKAHNLFEVEDKQ